MSLNPNETLSQHSQVKSTVRIPADLDAELERSIAGTGITKRQAVEMALREYLKLEAPNA